jgi:hypothetical protein
MKSINIARPVLELPHSLRTRGSGEVSGQNIINRIGEVVKKVKVIFGDMDEMLSELKEREIFEVRVAALYDERYSKEGISFLKAYVTIQALMSQHLYGPHERIAAYLYAHYEKVTFRSIKPFTKDEIKSVFDENLKAKDGITSHLVQAGFSVRAGHFREE